jgi:hypothetical protein
MVDYILSPTMEQRIARKKDKKKKEVNKKRERERNAEKH